MFLTHAGFKKLINEAYKLGGGLHLVNDGAGLIIAGTYWAMWIRDGKIPKKALGSIIELTGLLPEAGEAFRASKAGNQTEFSDVRPAVLEVAQNAENATVEMHDTEITIETIDGAHRLLQTETQQIYRVSAAVIKMVDLGAMEKDEGYPIGPILGNYKGVYWFNDHMAFMLLPIGEETKLPLIEYLERINIEKYKNRAYVPEATDEEEAENP